MMNPNLNYNEFSRKIIGRVIWISLFCSLMLSEIFIGVDTYKNLVHEIHSYKSLIQRSLGLWVQMGDAHQLKNYVEQIKKTSEFEVSVYDRGGKLLYASREDQSMIAADEEPVSPQLSVQYPWVEMSELSPLPPSQSAKVSGYLRLTKKISFYEIFLKALIYGLLLVLVVTISALAIISSTRLITAPLLSLSRRVQQAKSLSDLSQLQAQAESPTELVQLSHGIQTLAQRILENEGNIKKSIEGHLKFFDQAKFAHDVRSPLSALEALSTSPALSSDEAVLLRHTIDKIKSLSESYLDWFRKEENDSHTLSMGPFIFENLIALKKIEFSGSSIDIALYNNLHAPILVEANMSQLDAILSNLINNSVEACRGAQGKKVEIQIFRNPKNEVEIVIQDNGPGIPDDILQGMRKSRWKSSKTSGNGIGLKSAVQMIQQWNGNLSIDSKLGFGTTVTITLRAPAPLKKNSANEMNKMTLPLPPGPLSLSKA